jgi:hypothetical protein
MSQVLRFTTHFVADEIQPQYATAIQAADTNLYTYDANEAGQTVLIQGPQHKYTLKSVGLEVHFSRRDGTTQPPHDCLPQARECPRPRDPMGENR